ncbi:uncharacterized protein LOC113288101 isoform X1 [Papaver somniferum]|uniref:uncharacterized protein LOC113288101 isoform X1 n=1 Tax=Papaver somniferum TaxID=3469 RepID=UPI000E6F9FA0|nr:uncharacterized protein LOC113288101 isoform X1 [Papaver somniferum]
MDLKQIWISRGVADAILMDLYKKAVEAVNKGDYSGAKKIMQGDYPGAKKIMQDSNWDKDDPYFAYCRARIYSELAAKDEPKFQELNKSLAIAFAKKAYERFPLAVEFAVFYGTLLLESTEDKQAYKEAVIVCRTATGSRYQKYQVFHESSEEEEQFVLERLNSLLHKAENFHVESLHRMPKDSSTPKSSLVVECESELKEGKHQGGDSDKTSKNKKNKKKKKEENPIESSDHREANNEVIDDSEPLPHKTNLEETRLLYSKNLNKCKVAFLFSSLSPCFIVCYLLLQLLFYT